MAGKRKRTNRRIRSEDGGGAVRQEASAAAASSQPQAKRSASGAYIAAAGSGARGAAGAAGAAARSSGVGAAAGVVSGGRGRGRGRDAGRGAGRGTGRGGGRGGGRGRGGRGRGSSHTKRPAADEEIISDDEALADDGSLSGGSDSDEYADESASEGEEEETAEERRLRLAKAYLAQIEAEEREARADASGSGSEDEGSDGEDLVGARLRSEGLARQGYVRRELADVLGGAARAAGKAAAKAANAAGCVAGAAPGCGAATLLRGFRLAPTCVALAADERAIFAASKEGAILAWEWYEGEGVWRRRRFAPVPESARGDSGGAAGRARKGGGRKAADTQVLAMALSDDGALLATGGRDCRVHVWDAREGRHLQAFPGHKAAVLSLAFRTGTKMLYSASADRSVKLWSLDDMAYLDTLFGHQAEVTAVACGRRERPVTAGADRTCRAWKIHDETQLIFRGHSASIDCVAAINSEEWFTGGQDGGVAAWSLQRKKPTAVARHEGDGLGGRGGGEEGDGKGDTRVAPGAAQDCAQWVTAVAACSSSDLAASGAGDGAVRLWSVGKPGTGRVNMGQVAALPACGFVNGLALGVSGRTLVAAVGQEPRMGRWARNAEARNGILVYKFGTVVDDEDEDEEDVAEEDEEDLEGTEDGEDGARESDEEVIVRRRRSRRAASPSDDDHDEDDMLKDDALDAAAKLF